MSNPKIVVEIRAPHYGTVEDVNVYNIHASTIEGIAGDIRHSASFVNKVKAEIDDFELTQTGDCLSITLRIGGQEISYNLGKCSAEVTYGGLAYNVFQNLYALDKSLEGRLSLRPVIGLSPEMIQKLVADGFYPESSFLLPSKPRKSLMMVCDSFQLNLVTKKATIFEGVDPLTTPDVAIVSSYPSDRNEEELDHIRQYARQNPNLRLYLNPGGTQIRIGVQEFRDILSFISAAAMKLDEAGTFLRIENTYSSRADFARECVARFLTLGVGVVVLNDSEQGSYMGHQGSVYHTAPFSKSSIEGIVEGSVIPIVQNFSGCGDGIFSGMLYGTEVYADMTPEERLTFANAVTRLISLLPISNLYNVQEEVIKDILNMSKGYAGMVKRIE